MLCNWVTWEIEQLLCIDDHDEVFLALSTIVGGASSLRETIDHLGMVENGLRREMKAATPLPRAATPLTNLAFS